jgi:hypothetical protein|tara:strand:- start:2600 stop:3013 length:414 start_codon:yes stop_codon:yes gene_type:complete
MRWKRKKGTKIKKVMQDGIKFDSKLELYFYNLLKKEKIPFIFQEKFVLLQKFRYNGSAVREMTLTVDFSIPQHDMIVDTKGFQRNDNKIKWKLLKRHLLDNNREPLILMPKNQKQCQEVITLIKAMSSGKQIQLDNM